MKNIYSKSYFVAKSIKEKIQNKSFASGTKLPSMSRLAKTFNVAHGTIHSALKLLDQEGIIYRFPRSGTYVRGKNDSILETETLEPDASRAQSIADDIIANIAKGNLKMGNFLPQQKALVIDYRSTNKTISEALKIVEGKKLIHRHGSGYRIGWQSTFLPQLAPIKRHIYFMGSLNMYMNLMARRNYFFREFENEINKIGGLSIKCVDIDGGIKKAVAEAKWEEAVGILYVDDVAGSGEKFIEDLFFLSKTGLSIVGLNEGYEIVDKITAIPRNVFILQHDDEKAGEQTGMYLATLGHKSIAHFTYLGNEYCCRQQLTGLKAGMEAVIGSEAKVESYWATYIDTRYSQIIGLPVDKFRGAVSQVLNGYKFTYIDPATGISWVDSRKLSSPFLSSRGMLRKAKQLLNEDTWRRLMEPFFNKAIKRTEITAWVCTEPTLSITAVEHLKERGFSLPGDLSVVGIGDSDDCMLHRITATDIGVNRIGYLAAHCIIGDIPVRKNRRGIVECPVNMIIRGTAGAKK